VTGVEMFRQLLDEGLRGDNVGPCLRGRKRKTWSGEVGVMPGSLHPAHEVQGEDVRVTKEEGGGTRPFSQATGRSLLPHARVTGDVKMAQGVEMVMQRPTT